MGIACFFSSLNQSQDRKVRLNEWDGKALKEVAVLEGNQGQVSALAFSPNGKYLVAGDVRLSPLHYLLPQLMISCSHRVKLSYLMHKNERLHSSRTRVPFLIGFL